MLKSISKHVNKVSALRKLIFAIVNLPDTFPHRWEVAVAFATKDEEHSIPTIDARIMMENLEELDAAAFATDRKLLQELMGIQGSKQKPLGLVLISPNERCIHCKGKLALRKDRPVPLVIYDDIMGTVPGSHYHKYCSSRSCRFTQYYGYYTTGESTGVYYNSDWESLPYFVSSRETSFSIDFLRRINAEILIGQQSFKQCADLYNYLHGYNQGQQR
jgi:hypothetical protein